MVKDNRGKIMWILVAVIIVLVLVLLFLFVVRPSMNNFVVNKQIEGVNMAYGDVVNQIQTNGYFALPLGNNEAGEPQTLVLVPYVPPQDSGTPTQ